MPERNIELLEKTLRFIKDNPDRHDQSSWCGTAQCFCGWAAEFSGYVRLDEFGKYWRTPGVDENAGIIIHGATMLGLELHEAQTLFSSGNTIPMLELMVKDLVNGHQMHEYADQYRREAESLAVRHEPLLSSREWRNESLI